MYDRVILPIDGSQRALAPLPYAEHLARTWRRQLEVLHVATDHDGPPVTPPEDYDLTVVEAPAAAPAICDHARTSEPPALLCMASRGRTAVGEALFGTVTAQVIRHLHAPLVVTGPKLLAAAPTPLAPTQEPDLRRLLVCLDGSATSASILPTARTWASELGLELILLHITYPLGDPRIGELTVPEETREVTAQLRRTAHELTNVGIDATWHVIEDTHPPTGIIHQATHRGADLIVMATHGRTGLARMLTGSVTTEVVRTAPMPVLTLRPEHLT